LVSTGLSTILLVAGIVAVASSVAAYVLIRAKDTYTTTSQG